MKKTIHFSSIIIAFIILLSAISEESKAQLTVSTAMTPAQLVQNVLVGTGVTVSNITYTGPANSIGRFTTGATPTNLGLSSGVIMSTGYVNGTSATSTPPAIGCAATNFESSITNSASDPDLQTLVTSTISDACVLQFDFLPLSDTIKFRYVFASEEYPEFVCSTFNDVFGFFVSGANPAGGNYVAKNIALIPGTALPVAINTINSGSGSGSDPSCLLTYSMYYVDNTSGTSIVFDGFTTVLTAWCRVIPCTPYHIKLAIGDAGDESWDSGVFLEANSFSTNAVTIQTHFSSPIASTTAAIEGCNDAIITFSLANITTTPYPVTYTISGTATNGVDYTSIPNSVTIPPGQDSVNLVIHPFQDGIPEGTETVQLIFLTSICGASDTLTVNILNNNPFSVTSSNDVSICGGSANIAVYPSGGTSPYAYSWNNGAGTNATAVVSPSVTTTYNVTVTDLCGSTATESVVVSVGGSATVTAGSNGPICAGQTLNLTCTPNGATTYSWSGPNSFSSAVQNPGIANVTPAASGTYTVTESTAGCTGSSTVSVIVNPLPTVTVPANIVICNNGTVSATNFVCNPAGGTFTWTNSNTAIGLAANGTGNIPAFTATNTTTAAITATITVTPSANTCIGTPSTYTITVNPTDNPAFNYTPSTMCQTGTDQSAVITGGATGTFSATPAGLVFLNTSTGLIDVSASTINTYTVTYTTSGACPSNSTTTINIALAPLATFNYAGPYCPNGTDPLPVIAPGASAGVFSATPAGLVFISTATGQVDLSASTPGTYTVTNSIAASGGCVAVSATNTITINPTPTVTVPANIVICNNGTVATTAFASIPAGGTFAWTNSNTAIGLTANGTGDIAGFTATNTSSAPISATISVTPTVNGCVGTPSTYTITVNPTPTVTVPANITVCNNAAVAGTVYTSPTSGATYTWTNSNTAIGIGANGAGNIVGFTATNTTTAPITATITVTPTANTCIGISSTYTITVNPTPVVTVPANIVVCNGATVTGTSFSSTTAGATYTWTNSNTAIGIAASGTGNIAGFTATNSTTVPIIATITVTPNANNCVGTSSSYTITVNSIPTITALALPSSVCAGSSSSLSATSTDPGTTYVWNPGNLSGSPLSVTPGATTVYSVTGTTPAGCSGSSSVTVTINPFPVITFSAMPTLCVTSPSFTLNQASPAGGIYSGTGVSGNTFNPAIAGIGTQTITYTYTNPSTNCSSTNTTQITVTTGLTITVTPSDTTVCRGTDVTLIANGANSYIWTPNYGLSSYTSQIVSSHPSANTIYTVTGSNPDGCMGVTTASVNYFDSTFVNIIAVPNNGCSPLDVTFNYIPVNIIADSSWHWNFDDPYSSNNTSVDSIGHHFYQHDGLFTANFTAMDIYGCNVIANTDVNVFVVPHADFYSNPGIGITDVQPINFADFSTNAYYWLWDFGDPESHNNNGSDLMNPSHMYADSGTYAVQLIVTTNHNCSDTAYHTVYIVPNMIFWIPNAFTPNSDNKNEIFKPVILGIDRSTFQFLIYDRWGKQIFASTNVDLGWDGKYNGKAEAEGVYSYLITFSDYDGIKHKYTGGVTLLR